MELLKGRSPLSGLSPIPTPKHSPMELAHDSYPVRAFIRHKARMKILHANGDTKLCPTIDQTLLRELTETLFQSQKGNAIYAPYPSRKAAEAIEERFADEIATTYRHILSQRANSQIQWLNTLLG